MRLIISAILSQFFYLKAQYTGDFGHYFEVFMAKLSFLPRAELSTKFFFVSKNKILYYYLLLMNFFVSG